MLIVKKTNDIKEKLKELGIRLTELADYFNISRPTLYKHIESFDLNKLDQIPILIRNTLIFINREDVVSKKEVISFIINMLDRELVFDQHDLMLKEVYEKLKRSASNETLQFILNWIEHPEYTKFMETYNKYEILIKSDKKIEPSIIEKDFPSFETIYSLNSKEKKSKQKIENIIKHINDRRAKQ